jgi:hypothetical protein
MGEIRRPRFRSSLEISDNARGRDSEPLGEHHDPGKADERTCREIGQDAIGEARQFVGDRFPRQASRGALLGGAAPSAGALIVQSPAPLGADATAVQNWFDEIVEAEAAVPDGSLVGERHAAVVYARMAETENTGRPYRAAVRLVPEAPSPSPARLRRRCGGLRRERTWPRSHPRNPKVAPRRDPLPAPRRRPLPTDDVRSPRPWPASGAMWPARVIPPARRSRRPSVSCGKSSRRFAATSGACVIGRCFWLTLPGLCADRNSPAFALSNWSKRNVGSASPCR